MDEAFAGSGLSRRSAGGGSFASGRARPLGVVTARRGPSGAEGPDPAFRRRPGAYFGSGAQGHAQEPARSAPSADPPPSLSLRPSPVVAPESRAAPVSWEIEEPSPFAAPAVLVLAAVLFAGVWLLIQGGDWNEVAAALRKLGQATGLLP